MLALVIIAAQRLHYRLSTTPVQRAALVQAQWEEMQRVCSRYEAAFTG